MFCDSVWISVLVLAEIKLIYFFVAPMVRGSFERVAVAWAVGLLVVTN